MTRKGPAGAGSLSRVQRLCYLYLRLTGWRFAGKAPDVPRFVVVGAPHTSNWDFAAFLAAAHHFSMPAYFIGKHTLFRPPFGWLMRRFRGIPVHRDSKQGLVAQVVDQMMSMDRMALLLAPEGSRSKGGGWRSGFYRIAIDAGVPIVCASVDSATRTVELAEAFMPSGDIEADMVLIAEIYADKTGKRPERRSPVVLARD